MFLEFFPPPSPKFSACPQTRNLTSRKRRYVCSFVFQSEIVNYTHTRLRAKAGQARSICIRRAKQKRVYPRHRRACGTQEKDATGNRLETTQPACERRRGKRVAFASAERSKKGCTRGTAALAARKKKTQRMLVASFGTPDRSRTCDLQNRNLTLYPAELRVHARIYSICSRGDCPPFFEKGLQMCLHPRSGLSVICTESVPACSSSSKTISFSRSGSRIAPGR